MRITVRRKKEVEEAEHALLGLLLQGHGGLTGLSSKKKRTWVLGFQPTL